MTLTIEKLQELCAAARRLLGDTAIIAGGAVRDVLHGREPGHVIVVANSPFRGGAIEDAVQLAAREIGVSQEIELIDLGADPIDNVQEYAFALSQCFVTPRGLFYTERYLGDANGLTVTYVGDTDPTSLQFRRAVRQLQWMRERYAPEFKFRDCEALDKVAADSSL